MAMAMAMTMQWQCCAGWLALQSMHVIVYTKLDRVTTVIIWFWIRVCRACPPKMRNRAQAECRTKTIKNVENE